MPAKEKTRTRKKEPTAKRVASFEIYDKEGGRAVDVVLELKNGRRVYSCWAKRDADDMGRAEFEEDYRDNPGEWKTYNR